MATKTRSPDGENGTGNLDGSVQQGPTDEERLRIAFFSAPRDEAGRFLGAMLLTDARTRPLEFTYVKPVRVTKMQRVLYGGTLDRHVQIEVIGKRLVEALSHQPDAILVDNGSLLPLGSAVALPVMLVSRDDSSSSDSPVAVICDEYSENRLSSLIRNVSMRIDLLEPFDRVREAITEVLKELEK